MVLSREPIVSLRGVACGYGDTTVLEAIDLDVQEGEILALIGGSGSGKSTLLRTMIGLLPPRAGEVLLFGEPLYRLERDRRDALLRRTGMLFQQDALFGSLTLLDNVALPLRELTRLPAPLVCEIARMKLALVGLAELEDRLPSDVSGGQRKRAGLARASILDPAVVFCDEPIAGLDPVLAAEIDDLLLRFRDVLHVTVVLVTHELASIRAIADRIAMVGGGGLLASGSFEELSDSPDPTVHGFFHPAAGERATGPTVLEALEVA